MYYLFLVAKCLDHEQWCSYFPDCSFERTKKACPKFCNLCLTKEKMSKYKYNVLKFSFRILHLFRFIIEMKSYEIY